MSDRRTPPDPLPIEPYFRTVGGCEPFLRAIAEEPDDDAPRLVFADYLEERGHEARAEFIRLQCELQRDSDLSRSVADSLRQRELLNQHGTAWREGVDGAGPWFSRGMLEEASLSAFVRLSPEQQGMVDIRSVVIDNLGRSALAALLPCQRLRFVTRLRSGSHQTSLLADLLAPCTHLTGLRALELVRKTRSETTLDLSRLPFLSQLHSLSLSSHPLVESDLLRLLASPTFPRLRRLGLVAVNLGNETAQAIASSDKFTDLTHLDLSGNHLDSRAVIALAHSATLARLEWLSLHACRANADARQMLADARAFPCLRFLATDTMTVRNEGGVGLARVREWARTAEAVRPTRLDLSKAALAPEAIRELLASPAFETVTELNLQGGLAHPDALIELANAPGLAHVRILNVSRNRLKSEHVRALARSRHAVGLRELDVSDNSIGLEGAMALVTSPHLADLSRLNLRSNRLLARLIEDSPRFATLTRSTSSGHLRLEHQFDDSAARTLAATPTLADFTRLTLGTSSLTIEAFTTLMQSPYLANLTRLRVRFRWLADITWVDALVNAPHLGQLQRLCVVELTSEEARDRILRRWPNAVVSSGWVTEAD